ncbi:unnamed protein product [Brassicogethes aeneus]|nr:unnamed protein product [Brassicogethes aeneus]
MSTPECNEDVIFEQLVNIRITTPESVIRMGLLDGQALCSKLMTSLGFLKEYLANCRLPPTNLYARLINGLKTLDKMLCYDADYFQKFELFYYCIHELDKEFEICAGPPDWNEEHNHKKVCKTYKKMVDCYFIKVATVCSLEGAKVFKKLIVGVINDIINCPCDVSHDPEVKNPMPEQYIRKNVGEELFSGVKTTRLFMSKLFIIFTSLHVIYLVYSAIPI